MKRKGNIYQQICSTENLALAAQKARKGKEGQYGVHAFDKDSKNKMLLLQQLLINKTYQTSKYKTFFIHEPKEREVFALPFWPDRICHHAIMIPLERIFVSTFITDTYSCIKGKGIHPCSFKLRNYLKDKSNTQYCLQIDIKKFYSNINHDILKSLLRKKIKCADTLWLLDEIIDSAPGVPIGNLLSQYFANFYLAYFDHWIKEVLKVKYYLRYADDMVVLSGSKEYLHEILSKIRIYLSDNLKLELKDNYQVFRVAKFKGDSGRAINMVGYLHFGEVIYLRPSIKKRYARKVAKNRNTAPHAPYNGWIKHCNGKHLQKKLLAA